eukprot:9728956-Ditylum_brightwellii.AAC.1
MVSHVRIGELDDTTSAMNQCKKDSTTLLGQVSGTKFLCMLSGGNLCRLRSVIILLALDEALKIDSTITEHVGGEDIVIDATGRCQPATQAIMLAHL